MKHAALAVAAALFAGPGAAAVTSYDTLAAFEAALPGGASTVIETFDTDGNAVVLSFAGVTATSNGAFQRVQSGQYRAATDGDVPRSVTWDLAPDTVAFAFDVFGVSEARFDGVTVTVDDGDGPQSFVLFDVLGGVVGQPASGFAGFVGEGPIASISFTGQGGSTGTQDTFGLDDARFVTTPAGPAVIPLPASLPLVLGGLGTMAALRARGRRGA